MHLVVYCISSGIFQAVLSVFFFSGIIYFWEVKVLSKWWLPWVMAFFSPRNLWNGNGTFDKNIVLKTRYMNHLAIFFLESCWECVRRRTDILNEFVTIFPELTGNVLSAEVKLYLLHAVYGVVYSSCLSGHLGFLSSDGCLILTNHTDKYW